MRISALSAFTSIVIALASDVSADTLPETFQHPAMDRCFSGPKQFLVDVFGTYAEADPNFSAVERDTWTWIVDATPGRNYGWYGLRHKDGRYCLNAFVPAAVSVEPQGKHINAPLQAVVSGEANFPGKLIVLTIRAGSSHYEPSRCFVLGSQGVNGSRKAVSCSTIYD
jgi:hypothetical protein